MRAFNGDRYLAAEIARLCAIYGVNSAFETGTSTGDTTKALRMLLPTVATVDINQMAHLGDDVLTLRSDSPEAIRVHAPALPRPTLFYLDAHDVATGTCRVQDELEEIISLKLFDSVIVIHDFKVPDTDLGYDTYKDQPLDWDYVFSQTQRLFQNGYTWAYNQVAEGARRGVFFLKPKLPAALVDHTETTPPQS